MFALLLVRHSAASPPKLSCELNSCTDYTMLSSWYNVHTQLPTVALFCTAENNPSKSNSYPKHVYFFRSIQMTNFAALRAGHLSMKEYSWFVSSLLRVQAPAAPRETRETRERFPRCKAYFSRSDFPEVRLRNTKDRRKIS